MTCHSNRIMCCIVGVFFLGCGLGLAATDDGTGPFEGVLEQATKATGAEYFALKKQLLAADPTGALGQQESLDQSRSWQYRLIAEAARDAVRDPDGYEKAANTLVASVMNLWHSRIRPPQSYLDLHRENPRKLDPDSAAAKTLDELARSSGLLFEVIFVHTPDSFAELAAGQYVRQREERIQRIKEENKRRRAERDRLRASGVKAGFTFIGPPRPITREQWLKSFSDDNKMMLLIGARDLAARALVVSDSKHAITVLEETAKTVDHSPGRTAVLCLGFIGTDQAKQALQRVSQTDTKFLSAKGHAAQLLRDLKKQTKPPK